MLKVLDPPISRSISSERIIAHHGGEVAGPLFVSVAGVHGNEPSGVIAAQRVRDRLRSEGISIRGEWITLAGNLGALAAGRRFLVKDLNRIWTSERVERLRGEDVESLEAEDREQAELLGALEAAILRARGRVYLVDLHSTSADGVPFSVVEDTLRNRRLAFSVPVPAILGFEEEVGGALVEYLTDQGYICMTFEGGQHDSPLSIDHHEALLWLMIRSLGMLREPENPVIAESERVLRERTSGLPRAFEIRHRHGIRKGDRFRMLPNFRNFQRVRKGEVVAKDRQGAIQACQSGRIIMPLYQEQGDDGFFLGREFRLFWLHLSAWMRRLNLGAISPLLPGVHPHPKEPEWLIVDPGIARWFAVEFFHLLGFRRHAPLEDGRLVFSRRKHDW